jgi:hypothetical protein
VGGGFLLFAAPLTELLVASGLISARQQDSIMVGSAAYLLAWSGVPQVRQPPALIGTAWFLSSVSVHLLAGVIVFIHNVFTFDRIAGRPRRTTAAWKPAAESAGCNSDGVLSEIVVSNGKKRLPTTI